MSSFFGILASRHDQEIGVTPALTAMEKAGVSFQVHEYRHDPANTAYGMEAVEALGLEAGQVFKTLLVMLDGNTRRLAVGIIPVPCQLDLKAIARILGVRKAGMADGRLAEKTTGYVLGGISPLGQKKKLPTVLDTSALAFDTIFVSGGRRGLEIELTPATLLSLCQASTAVLCR
ncbi:MAG TPA: Cys-tRNA(Pro) deacylase [Thiolinea sp.]|nr:Cys-tRNA(Pro) deacylase [Thiolinea sp.]